ncbi:MAG TPA: hypothetical protein VNT01_12080 [Symbiobacteriaceae bacterium]|nr:hypothetical protein [Symbiobacteriaceae bacterium]
MDAELLLQQIDALLDKKLAPVMARLDSMEARLDSMEARLDRVEHNMFEDRKALMETLNTIDRQQDRLEQRVEELISRSNDQSVRHRHLVHKVAELEETVAVAQAK